MNMANWKTRIAALAGALVLSGCVMPPTVPPHLREARSVSESILLLDPNVPAEQWSCLIPASGISVETVDGRLYSEYKQWPGIYEGVPSIIPAGTYVLGIRYVSMYQGSWGDHTEGVMKLNAVLAPGKFYTMTYTIKDTPNSKGKILADLALVEVTDPKVIAAAQGRMAEVKNYLAWSQAHPGALDGSYKSKGGNERWTFSGHRFKLFKYAPETIGQGTVWYGPDTIILRAEPEMPVGMISQADAKPIKNLASSYTASSDMLDFGGDSKYYRTTDVPPDKSLPRAKDPQAWARAHARLLDGAYRKESSGAEISFADGRFRLYYSAMGLGGTFEGAFSLDEKNITLEIETGKLGILPAFPQKGQIVLAYYIDEADRNNLSLEPIGRGVGTLAENAAVKGLYRKIGQ